jgi:hypothetical protein
MSRWVASYTEARDRRRGLWWVAGLLAGAMAIASVLGVMFGLRLGHEHVRVVEAPRAQAPPAVTANPSTHALGDSGPTNVVAGVPIGYAHSPDGASSAAVNYLDALAGPQLLDPSAYDALLRRMTTGYGFAQLKSQADAGRPQALQNLGVGGSPAPQVIVRSAPLGYRIDAYSPAQATVSIWSVGVVGSSTTRPPDASWSTTTITVDWQDGDWWMSGYRTASGPVPPDSASQVPSLPSDLFAASPQFRGFAYVHP